MMQRLLVAGIVLVATIPLLPSLRNALEIPTGMDRPTVVADPGWKRETGSIGSHWGVFDASRFAAAGNTTGSSGSDTRAEIVVADFGTPSAESFAGVNIAEPGDWIEPGETDGVVHVAGSVSDPVSGVAIYVAVQPFTQTVTRGWYEITIPIPPEPVVGGPFHIQPN